MAEKKALAQLKWEQARKDLISALNRCDLDQVVQGLNEVFGPDDLDEIRYRLEEGE